MRTPSEKEKKDFLKRLAIDGHLRSYDMNGDEILIAEVLVSDGIISKISTPSLTMYFTEGRTNEKNT